MNENVKWTAAAAAVVALAGGSFLYLSRNDRTAPPETAVAARPAPPAMPEEPAIKHPLPELATQEPLPPLVDSDQPMQEALASLIGREAVEQFVISTDLARHIVVTIDNLPNSKVAERVRPIKRTPGNFAIGGAEDALVLDAANYERYKPLVQLIRSSDTPHLVATYMRYYPLLQEAYESLGHPPQYFNDRVIEVIDHLLLTPDLQGAIALTQPNVQYEFADPEIESRSAGQKVLLRMGSDNASAVKTKLRELRAALIAHQPAN